MSINLRKDEVKQVVQALKKTSKTSDELLDGSEDVLLQFTVKKISKINKTIKIKLPHGLYKKNTDVCLFVKDLDKESREYELSQDHFKDLLSSKGVTCVSEVIPLKALRLEYKPYEAKRNLSKNFDIYLADSRVVRRLPVLLGNSFYGRKRQPIQVNLEAKDLQKEFSNAVNNTRCIMTGRGSASMVKVAHFEMKIAEIIDNIIASIDQLSATIPGGAPNIKNIYIKTKDSLALPLYVSIGGSEKVQLPAEEQKQREVIVEDITTVEDGEVEVSRFGDIRVIREGDKPEKQLKRKNKGNKKQKSSKKQKLTIKDSNKG